MTQPISCDFSVSGEGPALILVHGIGASRATWATALPLLEPHFTVIAYDLRGHGASPQPEGRFELDALVADLEHVREQAGVDAAHIAGHSLGGMIGPAYARAFPDRVLSLGLLSTAAFRTEKDSANVKAVVAAMRERGIANVLGTLAHRWFTDGFIAVAQQHGDYLVEREGFPRSKVCVIPNGVDTYRFRSLPDSGAAVRQRLGIPEQAPVCGIVAALRV